MESVVLSGLHRVSPQYSLITSFLKVLTYRCRWGYLQTGSGAPKDIKPLISRLIDIPYTSAVCRNAFDIHKPTEVEYVNKYGAFDIEYLRLAFIDGSADPWLQATPQSSHARKRPSTIDKPFIMINDAVHHCELRISVLLLDIPLTCVLGDENGLFPNETTKELPPKRIKKVQAEEIRFVKKWLRGKWHPSLSYTSWTAFAHPTWADWEREHKDCDWGVRSDAR